MIITSIDNISEEVLDLLKLKYSDENLFSIIDNRKKISLGKKQEYFLLQKKPDYTLDSDDIEYTFIWIGNNIWQYTFLNINCTTQGLWRDPLKILNNLLK